MKRVFRSPTSRLVGAVAVSGALLVPLGVFGGSALARTASSSAAQYQYKVTVCHHTGSKKHPWHLVTISNRAVRAHLRHGDVMPPCPTTQTIVHHHGKPSTAGVQGQSGTQGHHEDEHGNGKDNSHHGKP
jgi:hypothetical protein